MGGGHYTAIAKNRIDKNWYCAAALHAIFAHTYFFTLYRLPRFLNASTFLSSRYLFNDSVFRPVGNDVICSRAAYVLFYQKVP